MTRITIFLLLAATLLVLSGLAAIRPQNPALEVDPIIPANPKKESSASTAHSMGSKISASSPQTSSGPIPPPLPETYKVLLKRSIFARDGRPSTLVPGAVAGGRNVPGQWVGPPGTEATLVFRGVTLTDGSYSAYIEDLTGGAVRRFSQGEDVAAGRIAEISLNGMDYQAGQKMTRITLGQNLAGVDAPPPRPPTTAPASAPPPPDGNPRGPGRGRPPGFPPGGPPGPTGAEPGQAPAGPQ